MTEKNSRYSRDGEIVNGVLKKEGELIKIVVEQRLVIESLLLRVEKLEETTRCSSIVEKVPSIGVGTKVDDTPSM